MARLRTTHQVAIALVCAIALTACGSGDDAPAGANKTSPRASTPPAQAEPDRASGTRTAPSATAAVTVAAVGDVACADPSPQGELGSGDDWCQQEATARLVTRLRPRAVLLLGDAQYEDATAEEFRTGYDPTWGRFNPITRAAVGNHEYQRYPDARGFFDYFGAAAGPRGRGWFSFDLGGWHLIALNSNCGAIGGCGGGSPQLTWLRRDLAASRARCTLAYWHAPRFSSGPHGNDEEMQPIWAELADAGAELVLNGHDHIYERFAPLDAAGDPDPQGMREMIVGTGGEAHFQITDVQPHSQVRNDTAFGVLRLRLTPTSGDWRFLPVPGASFTDAGTVRCH